MPQIKKGQARINIQNNLNNQIQNKANKPNRNKVAMAEKMVNLQQS